MRLVIPLRNLIQVMKPYVEKEGENLISSSLAVDGLLSHYSICSDFDVGAALGNFRDVLGKEGDCFLAQSPDFRANYVRDIVIQEVLSWKF